jgi:hypothetical protein
MEDLTTPARQWRMHYNLSWAARGVINKAEDRDDWARREIRRARPIKARVGRL